MADSESERDDFYIKFLFNYSMLQFASSRCVTCSGNLCNLRGGSLRPFAVVHELRSVLQVSALSGR